MSRTDIDAGLSSETIAKVETRQLSPRLDPPWGANVDHLGVIVVTIRAEDGTVGTGFTWTPGVGASAIERLIVDDIAPFVLRSAQGHFDWDEVARHLGDLGSGGVGTSAMAGVDMALWDLAGRRSGRPLSEMVAAARATGASYSSGINWHFSFAELETQVRRWIDAGAEAVKIKVGAPRPLAEDRARVSLVRTLIGPDRALMIDANQRWTREEAAAAIDCLADFNLTWVEEPLAATDLEGLQALARRSPAPLATGENLHRDSEFAAATAGAAVLQPSVTRVGGITPFLRIATAAEARGARLAPHLLPEVSGQLAVAFDHSTIVEVPDGATFTDLGLLICESPVRVSASSITVLGRSGVGLDFVAQLDSARGTATR